MNLAWEEYRKNATAFAHEWAHETNEKAEAHSFWDDFFRIFNLERRHLKAKHEANVPRPGRGQGFIDLFWRGKLLVEHKSAHKDKPADWDETYRQALAYIAQLAPADKPQKLVLCNFQRFRIYDLTGQPQNGFTTFPTTELPQHIREFAFFPEFANILQEEEEKANLEAALQLSTLHGVLHSAGYRGHDLELLLARVLFCWFADDTGIFEPKQFATYIEKYTLENGKDIGSALMELFDVLNTSPRKRPPELANVLRQFPYVNGGLFAENLSKTPPSSIGLRNTLLTCGMFDWQGISPEIFGSLFQAVLDESERRTLGAHYTSERNIRRVIDPLFMRSLWQEFRSIRKSRKKLHDFRQRLQNLRILDPACGCGNFLVVTYRELRLLDMEVVRALRSLEGADRQYVTDTSLLANVKLTQFYGMEIKPVSALIAQVALYITEHQCNRLLLENFGATVSTIPLEETPHVSVANALQTGWETLLPKGEHFDFIIGNPPFSGSKIMENEQRDEIKTLFDNASGSGTLDYVSGWYKKAALYLDRHPQTLAAFVSTNSICQGEQVGVLWGELLEAHGIRIRFAHQTFKWTNEAPGMAAVYCIIVGFGKEKPQQCLLFEYEDIRGEPVETVVKNINPYLVEAENVVVRSRSKPLCDVPEIGIGNKPIDGGHYLFKTEEKEEFLKKEPRAASYFRRWIGSDEFIKGYERWCLWLGEEDMEVLKKIPLIWERVEAVKQTRLASKSAPTRKLAEKPTRFHVENMPKGNYLVVPKVSSERRRYIPIGYESPETLSSDLVFIIPDATLYLFGILHSEMHMAWVRYVCGRLESRYRYSKDIVYNNFPFPPPPGAEQQQAVEAAAEAMHSIRQHHQSAGKTLAQLYDPDKMPADLRKAHQSLDRAVDACYGVKKPFATEAKRVAFLFGLYEGLVKGEEKGKKK